MGSQLVERVDRLIRELADMKLDGEEVDGEEFIMENDDAVITMNLVIQEARKILSEQATRDEAVPEGYEGDEGVANEPDYDPGAVMESLENDDLIDIVWAVLEGGDPLGLALHCYRENQEDEGDE